MASSDMYSVSSFHYELYHDAWSFKLADLIDPVPDSAYLAQPVCPQGDNIYGTIDLNYP